MGRLETANFKNHKRVGFILLIENYEFEEIQKWNFIISKLIQNRHSFVIAINERKDSPTMPPEMLHAILELDPKIPVLACNAKDDQRSCELVLLKCLEQLPQDKIVRKTIEYFKREIEDT